MSTTVWIFGTLFLENDETPSPSKLTQHSKLQNLSLVLNVGASGDGTWCSG